MVTTKLNLSMTEPQVRQIYAKQGDTGRVLDISLDQTPEDGTLRILRPDGTEVTSEAVTGGEVESGETFDSLTEADVTELTVGIEPVQDLNGYDKPWVGGAGKNKLVYPYTDTTKTASGITFTDNGDGSIKLNGTATANIDFYFLGEQATYYSSGLASGSYTMRVDSGSGTYTGDINKFVVEAVGNTLVGTGITSGGGSTFQLDSTKNYRIFVRVVTGTIVNNLVLRPMIYLATETDPTWQPYSNICPITGHDEVTVTDEGVNLLNYDAWKNVDVVRGTAVWENNGVTLTATSNDCYTDYGVSFPNDAKIEVTEGETITLAWDATPTNIGIVFVFPNAQASGMVVANSNTGHISYTVASGVTYLTFRFGVANSGVTASYKNIQIVRGTTVPTWTPYQGSTYTTSLGQTVYGGTLDMVSGVLTVDKAMVDLSSLSWTYDGSVPRFFSYGIQNTVKAPSLNSEIADIICTQYISASLDGDVSLYGGLNGSVAVSAGKVISVRDEAYTSASTFKDAMEGVMLCYALATPVEYQLTAQQIKTLVGTNNVWASSGDIVNITFTYGGLLSELPSEATEIVGKCYCDIEQNGVSSMPFTLNVKKNERES